MSTPSQLKDEALGFVKDGWTLFEIKIKLFDEAEFDEKIRRISGLRHRLPRQWKEADSGELLHVEGLSLNNIFLLQRSLSVDGSGQYGDIPYTFVLNKYKYFATYEVCSVKQSLLRRDPFLLFRSVKCLKNCC